MITKIEGELRLKLKSEIAGKDNFDYFKSGNGTNPASDPSWEVRKDVLARLLLQQSLLQRVQPKPNRGNSFPRRKEPARELLLKRAACPLPS